VEDGASKEGVDDCVRYTFKGLADGASTGKVKEGGGDGNSKEVI